MSDALTDYLPPACGVEGCEVLGPFTTDDGPRCFEHSGLANIPTAAEVIDGFASLSAVKARARKPRKSDMVPADELNDTAARALAALVLQATADALTTDVARMEQAIVQLAADLPAPLEVAAGVLFATTALAGTAGLVDQEVFVIGAAFEDQAAEESTAAADEQQQQPTDEPIERGDDEQDSE